MTEINCLPDEMLEHIFSFLPPYEDLESCKVVCRRWNAIVKTLVRRIQINWFNGLTANNLEWETYDTNEVKPETGPMIAHRFAHCAVINGNKMYVFGGISKSKSTTFNDLWSFDLSSRRWSRVTAKGKYPSPRAWTAMASYKNKLLLLGGSGFPAVFPVYQNHIMLDELNILDLDTMEWRVICDHKVTPEIPKTSGHGVSIIKNRMYVYGGFIEDPTLLTVQANNEIYSFDLEADYSCQYHPAIGEKPEPRVGHYQGVLGKYVVVVGGTGVVPNSIYNDLWAFDVELSKWSQIRVENPKSGPTKLRGLPICIIDTMLVVISVAPIVSYGTMKSMEMAARQPAQQPPPRHENCRQDRLRNILDRNMNQNNANLLAQANARIQQNQAENNIAGGSHLNRSGTSSSRASVFGFKRMGRDSPQISQERLRRLNAFEQRHAQEMEAYKKKVNSPLTKVQRKRCNTKTFSLYVADLSSLLNDDVEPSTVWQHYDNDNIDGAPERLQFTSLVPGHGEMILFGGIISDHPKGSDETFSITDTTHRIIAPRYS